MWLWLIVLYQHLPGRTEGNYKSGLLLEIRTRDLPKMKQEFKEITAKLRDCLPVIKFRSALDVLRFWSDLYQTGNMFILFICGIFNDAVTISDHIAPNGWVIGG
jgi:hypothetical protein